VLNFYSITIKGHCAILCVLFLLLVGFFYELRINVLKFYGSVWEQKNIKYRCITPINYSIFFFIGAVAPVTPVESLGQKIGIYAYIIFFSLTALQYYFFMEHMRHEIKDDPSVLSKNIEAEKDTEKSFYIRLKIGSQIIFFYSKIYLKPLLVLFIIVFLFHFTPPDCPVYGANYCIYL
jgi:hypothetical protein